MGGKLAVEIVSGAFLVLGGRLRGNVLIDLAVNGELGDGNLSCWVYWLRVWARGLLVVGIIMEKVEGIGGGGGKSFRKLGESGSMSDRRYSSLGYISVSESVSHSGRL